MEGMMTMIRPAKDPSKKFEQACRAAKLPMTRRQQNKFNRQVGKAYEIHKHNLGLIAVAKLQKTLES